jgi:hypothetical protein
MRRAGFSMATAPAGAGRTALEHSVARALSQPDEPAGHIPFTSRRQSEVTIEIYDLAGHRVRSQAESLPAVLIHGLGREPTSKAGAWLRVFTSCD